MLFGPRPRDVEAAHERTVKLFEMGRVEEAEGEARSALALATQVFGEETEQVFDALSLLAEVHAELGDADVAAPFARRRIELGMLLWGPADPRVVEALLDLGEVLRALGEVDEAQVVLHRAVELIEADVGSEDLDLVLPLTTLGDVLCDAGRAQDAEHVLARAIRVIEREGMADDPRAREAYASHARALHESGRTSESEAVLRRLVGLIEADDGSEPFELVRTLNQLSFPLRDEERFPEAEAVLGRAIDVAAAAFDADDPRLTVAIRNRATLREDMGKTAESDDDWQRVLVLMERASGPDSIELGDALSEYGDALYHRVDPEQAEPVIRRAIDVLERAGADAGLVGPNANRLAGVLNDLGRFEEAEVEYRRAVDLSVEAYSEDDPAVAICLTNLSDTLLSLRRPADAEPLVRRALSILEAEDDPDELWMPYSRLGDVLQEQERLEESEEAYARATELGERAGVDLTPEFSAMLRDRAGALAGLERARDAEGVLRRALDVEETVLGGSHPEVAWTSHALAMVLSGLDREESEHFARRAVVIAESDDALAPAVPVFLTTLGAALIARDSYVEAEQVLARAASNTHTSELPEDDTVWMRDRWAEALLELGRYEEAERLLQENLTSLGSPERDTEAYSGTIAGLAKVAHRQGRLQEAEASMLEAIELRKQACGDDEPELAFGYTRLAEIRHAAGRTADAIQARDIAWRLAERLPSDDADAVELRERLEGLAMTDDV